MYVEQRLGLAAALCMRVIIRKAASWVQKSFYVLNGPKVAHGEPIAFELA
jgi:hypothetical protein